MIQINIEYHVLDREGQKFRPLADIARDVESEFRDSSFLCEASYYKIIVENGNEYSIIEYNGK